MKKLDWSVIIIPPLGVCMLCVLFVLYPIHSRMILDNMRTFLGDECGVFYLAGGVAAFLCTLYMAFSRFGNITLGNATKPEYTTYRWGILIFTSTMAADILFYSLCEWALYSGDPLLQQGNWIQGASYPLFHWGPIAWSFYIVLTISFGFMIHVRKREKQKFSEALRPLIGIHADGPLGASINIVATFAIISGTSTTFSVATPLMTAAIAKIFNISTTLILTIIILLLIAIVYTIATLTRMRGISRLANSCAYVFYALLIYVFIGGKETRFIIETGFSSIGYLFLNFSQMATYADPLRETSFPQNWTVFYWAYWIAWAVAAPFFIARISRGRTIKNTVKGCYFWGLSGTYLSFIILGNYGLAQQLKHNIDTVGEIANGAPISDAIIRLFDTLPLPLIGLLLLSVTMIAFYGTTFDALTVVVAGFSYKHLNINAEPEKKLLAFWAIIFILFPIALLFSESTIYNLQSVSIIAAFPLGIVIILVVIAFFIDARTFLKEKVNEKLDC